MEEGCHTDAACETDCVVAPPCLTARYAQTNAKLELTLQGVLILHSTVGEVRLQSIVLLTQ